MHLNFLGTNATNQQYSWQKQWNLPALSSQVKSISIHTVSGSNPVTGLTDTCISVQVIIAGKLTELDLFICVPVLESEMSFLEIYLLSRSRKSDILDRYTELLSRYYTEKKKYS